MEHDQIARSPGLESERIRSGLDWTVFADKDIGVGVFRNLDLEGRSCRMRILEWSLRSLGVGGFQDSEKGESME